MRADTAVVSPLAERTAGAQEAAARIAAMLPQHTHYVQLQSGGLEVLLHKPPSHAETINDTSQDVVTFWRVLRDRPHELHRVCALTPLSRIEFDTARGSGSHLGADDLEAARRVWVVLTQSADGPARMRPQWRGTRRRRQHTEPGTDIEQMESLAQRLKEVTLECLPAVKVVEAHGGHRGVCFYADLRANLLGAQGADPGAAFHRTRRAAVGVGQNQSGSGGQSGPHRSRDDGTARLGTGHADCADRACGAAVVEPATTGATAPVRRR